jgi:polar amino acid transport system substrate-binding protein
MVKILGSKIKLLRHLAIALGMILGVETDVMGNAPAPQEPDAQVHEQAEPAEQPKDQPAGEDVSSANRINASDILKRDSIKGGWYVWDPYQYVESGAGVSRLTGMDVQLTNHYANAIGLNVVLEEVSWKQHLEDIKVGKRDIVASAAEVAERKEWGHYSLSYRSEENVAFILRQKSKDLPFKTPQEMVALVKKKKLKIAVVDGYHYASKDVMDFVNDPANAAQIVKSKNDIDNFQLLMQRKADIYLVDRVVGATLAWRTKNLNSVEERRLNMTFPVYFVFSQKTIPMSVVDMYNNAIKTAKESGEYGKIVSQYLFPVLLLQTLDSQWFFILEVVGIIAFAISGLVIAYEEKANFFGTLVMTALPSVGGGIMRDIIAQRTPLGIVKSPSYLFIVVAVVVVAFVFMNIYKFFFDSGKSHFSKQKLHDIGNTVIQISDAIGLGAFTIVGVTVAVIVKADPLWFWGPLLAAVTGVGGGFARDLLRSYENRSCLTGEFYAEIALIWGLIFAIIMQAQTEEVNSENIIYAVIFAAAGAAITRIIAFFFKVPGIPFTFMFNKGTSATSKNKSA